MLKKSIIASVLGLMVLGSGSAVAEIRNVNESINTSGKARATSQRLARMYMEKCLNKANAASSVKQGITVMTLLQEDLQGFSKFKSNQDTMSQLGSLVKEWGPYRTALEAECTPENAKNVYQLSESYGALANTFVGTIQKNHGVGVGAKLVNQAGKQRYFSLRIAKYALAGKAGVISSGEAQNQINKYKSEWLASQKELKKAASSRASLEEVIDEASSKFNDLMENISSGNINVNSISSQSESLLDTLNTQVKMFEGNE